MINKSIVSTLLVISVFLTLAGCAVSQRGNLPKKYLNKIAQIKSKPSVEFTADFTFGDNAKKLQKLHQSDSAQYRIRNFLMRSNCFDSVSIGDNKEEEYHIRMELFFDWGEGYNVFKHLLSVGTLTIIPMESIYVWRSKFTVTKDEKLFNVYEYDESVKEWYSVVFFYTLGLFSNVSDAEKNIFRNFICDFISDIK